MNKVCITTFTFNDLRAPMNVSFSNCKSLRDVEEKAQFALSYCLFQPHKDGVEMIRLIAKAAVDTNASEFNIHGSGRHVTFEVKFNNLERASIFQSIITSLKELN